MKVTQEDISLSRVVFRVMGFKKSMPVFIVKNLRDLGESGEEAEKMLKEKDIDYCVIQSWKMDGFWTARRDSNEN